MESRIQRLFLTVLLGFGAASAAAAGPGDLDLAPLAIQEPERRTVSVDSLDSENFEFGVFAGMMNVTDFGTNALTGVRGTFHVTEDIFIEGAYGRTRLDRTSFERLSGAADILTDDQRNLSYYSMSLGYNILPGEAFLGSSRAYKGALYLIGGAGTTEFGGDDLFTINAGFGYRLIARDWLALHLSVRDHMLRSDLLGTKETYHNVEFSGAVTVFF